MIYGYIRVSSDKQTTENQRFEIVNYSNAKAMPIDEWVEETISSTKKLSQRRFGSLLDKMQKGDILICSELSRLGRNLMQVMGILNVCMEKEIQVYTIKDNFKLGNDISSKVLAFAFGLSAEIERQLISQRTKEALARKRAEGIILGRPKGAKSSRRKLTGKEAEIKDLLDKKISISAIARILGVNRITVAEYCSDNGIRDKQIFNYNRTECDKCNLFINKKRDGFGWCKKHNIKVHSSENCKMIKDIKP